MLNSKKNISLLIANITFPGVQTICQVVLHLISNSTKITTLNAVTASSSEWLLEVIASCNNCHEFHSKFLPICCGEKTPSIVICTELEENQETNSKHTNMQKALKMFCELIIKCVYSVYMHLLYWGENSEQFSAQASVNFMLK